MNNEIRNHIHLRLRGECSSKLRDILEAASFHLESSLEDAHFIITDYFESGDSFQVPTLLCGEINNEDEFYRSGGKAIIKKDLLNSSIGEVLIKRFFGLSSSLSLDKLQFEQEVGHFVLENPFSLGYYEDILVCEASKAGFDGRIIREFFHSLGEFYFLLSLAKKASFPFEIDFIKTDSQFIIQSNIKCHDIGTDVFFDFKETSDSFSRLLKVSDVIDCYVLENAGRVAITSLWDKEYNLKGTRLYSNIPNFSKISYRRDYNSKHVKKVVRTDLPDAETTYTQLEGLEQKLDSSRSLSKTVLERIIKFVSDNISDPETVDAELVKEVLTNYPARERVEKLTASEIDEIVELVKNSREISHDDDKTKIKIDSAIDDLINVVKGLSLDEAEEIIKVRGQKEEAEFSQLVKGAFEELDEQTYRVAGDKGKEEFWKVKKLELVERVKSLEDDLKGKSLSEVEAQLGKIIQDIFKSDENESHDLSRDLLSKTCDKINDKESIPHVVSDLGQVHDSQLKHDLEVKDKQIERLRSLVDNMRARIEAQAEAQKLSSQDMNELSEEQQISVLEGKIIQLTAESKKKDHYIEQLKQNITVLNENFDEKKKALEASLAEQNSKITETKNSEVEHKEKFDVLKATLQESEKKNASLSEELIAVKESQADLALTVKKLSDENEELKSKVQTEKEDESKSSLSDEEIENLIKLEARHKALELKYKQIEQKNKFLGGKVKELEKKAKMSKSSSNKSAAALSPLQIKQLEMNAQKHKEMYDKISGDIQVKKKENHKLKTEGNAMKLRIQELERKLAKFEKNAA
ncbi:hypothetical protein HBN50_13805 [Halobacteriovorax sp. GB3]|uniref:hypothetical protein n=1 Tax=Halobacteriovorax sp. GB3 TaxID=2719615 RepID=UPI0023612BF5|nr:hypothetical protein [Halobacteriovorax sp. GB3]MDD0854182.1 hypothetical protein [Halobacteriovorax sp. GB3]